MRSEKGLEKYSEFSQQIEKVGKTNNYWQKKFVSIRESERLQLMQIFLVDTAGIFLGSLFNPNGYKNLAQKFLLCTFSFMFLMSNVTFLLPELDFCMKILN